MFRLLSVALVLSWAVSTLGSALLASQSLPAVHQVPRKPYVSMAPVMAPTPRRTLAKTHGHVAAATLVADPPIEVAAVIETEKPIKKKVSRKLKDSEFPYMRQIRRLKSTLQSLGAYRDRLQDFVDRTGALLEQDQVRFANEFVSIVNEELYNMDWLLQTASSRNDLIMVRDRLRALSDDYLCMLGHGQIFIGFCTNGEFHEWGILEFANGDLYVGEFANGLMHGQGKYRWTNEAIEIYEGQWEKGLPHGQGVEYYRSGDTFLKTHLDADTIKRIDGFIQTNSEAYRGEFKNGKRHGQGTETLWNGESYTGDFNEGLRHGTGKLTLSDGDVYTGAFKHGKRHGRGALNSDGTIFDGLWVDDRKAGEPPAQRRIIRKNNPKKTTPKVTIDAAVDGGDRYQYGDYLMYDDMINVGDWIGKKP